MKTSMYNHEQNVHELQTALRGLWQNDKILTLINPDGVFGPKTVVAVTEAQNFFGLPETGEADFETWKLIFDTYLGEL